MSNKLRLIPSTQSVSCKLGVRRAVNNHDNDPVSNHGSNNTIIIQLKRELVNPTKLRGTTQLT